MALGSRLAGPDNALPSLPASDRWLSKEKNIAPLGRRPRGSTGDY